MPNRGRDERRRHRDRSRERSRDREPREPQGGQGPRVLVGSTGNSPELVETIPIATELGASRQVVLSFGAQSKTDSPLPDLAPGDRLEVFAELEVTTDAEDPNHPGLVGSAYSYAPKVEASLLLAAGPEVSKPGRRAIELAKPWRGELSHQKHHGVIDFAAKFEIPDAGLPWSGPVCINVVLAAAHRKASSGNVLLIGQNEKTPTVVQDMAGIRVVRSRRGAAGRAERNDSCLVAAVPVAKLATVVLSHRLDDLAAGEQLLVVANLVTDASPLGYAARISTRLFLADGPDQLEPGGRPPGSPAGRVTSPSSPASTACPTRGRS